MMGVAEAQWTEDQYGLPHYRSAGDADVLAWESLQNQQQIIKEMRELNRNMSKIAGRKSDSGLNIRRGFLEDILDDSVEDEGFEDDLPEDE
jgi:hypothetical protein